VNGKEVSGGENCNYRKGYLALESEGAPVEFRNLRLKELPSSGAGAEMTAPLDSGLRTIFTGLDLRGWQTNTATAARWQAGGNRIALKAGDANPEATLWTDKKFGNAEFILDCRQPKAPDGREVVSPAVRLRGADGKPFEIKLTGAAGNYQRFSISVKGHDVTVKRNDEEIQRLTLPASTPEPGVFGLCDTGGVVEFMNLYARDL
jgi:hypothetical protein